MKMKDNQRHIDTAFGTAHSYSMCGVVLQVWHEAISTLSSKWEHRTALACLLLGYIQTHNTRTSAKIPPVRSAIYTQQIMTIADPIPAFLSASPQVRTIILEITICLKSSLWWPAQSKPTAGKPECRRHLRTKRMLLRQSVRAESRPLHRWHFKSI